MGCRLVFRSVTMGIVKAPMGEVTAHMQTPEDPSQPDKLTITTIQAGRWMLPGGLQASRQAQLFPGRRVIWQLATMMEQMIQAEWGLVATGNFRQVRASH